MIKKLDSITIDKIAAGEVVERPASAIKELLENSIDAKASHISVSIKNGGKSEIVVQDDGKGIEHSELPLAVMRHATSKIENFEDLENVLSLGFRGEALASIASVAKLEIISKTENDIAWRYEINGGKEIVYEESAGVKGTKITIKDIFYNVPARQKYLKSDSTEASHIGKKVQNIALSHPEISFTYKVDGKEKMHTSGSNDIKKLIFEIFGKAVIDDGRLIDEYDDGVHLYGFLGSPSIGRGNKNNELTFINGRLIENITLNHAINEGYSGFLMEHKYPFAVLYLDINPSETDVNVHPTKKDIKLMKANKIHNFLTNAIKNKLNSHKMVHSITLGENIKGTSGRLDTYNDRLNSKKGSDSLYRTNDIDDKQSASIDLITQDSSKEDFLKAMKKRVEDKYEKLAAGQNDFENSKENDKHEQSEGIFEKKLDQVGLDLNKDEVIDANINIIGQVFKTYWLVEYESELLIIDQHAAHEKVLYERYMNEFANKTLTTQVINPPIMITLPIEEENYIDMYDNVFKEYGFEIESVGEKDYLLRGVPYELEELGTKEAFQNFLDELFLSSAITPTPRKLKEKIAMSACKAAVKGNNILSKMEMKELLKEMMKLENPYHCPHGRPTLIKMTRKELEKHFGRLV